MRRSAVLVLVLISTLAFAQNSGKKKQAVPAVFNQARFVWVESMDGDLYTPGLLPADRQAIIDVQDALRQWGRYVLTGYRKDAELIFVVRTGRIAEGKAAARVGTTGTLPTDNPNPRQSRDPNSNTGMSSDPMGVEVALGASAGPPNDLLKVVAGNDAKRGTQLWLRSEKGGLGSPDVPLMSELKQIVDHDYPR